jgi:hypothetical protein
MIGPHHSIILRFTATEHGAVMWSRLLRREVVARRVVGIFSIRTNIFVTHWLFVTWYFSMHSSAASGSNCSMTITVPPRRIVLMQ